MDIAEKWLKFKNKLLFKYSRVTHQKTCNGTLNSNIIIFYIARLVSEVSYFVDIFRISQLFKFLSISRFKKNI